MPPRLALILTRLSSVGGVVDVVLGPCSRGYGSAKAQDALVTLTGRYSLD